MVVSFPLPSRPSVLAKPPFGEPITAQLVWLYCAPDDTRLGWLVSLTTPGDDEHYDVIVDAGLDAEVLYCKSSYLCVRGRATIFPHDPGGLGEERQVADLPLPRDAYPEFVAAGPSDPFGKPWITRRHTRGNNTDVFRGNRRSTLEGQTEGGGVTFACPDIQLQSSLNVLAWPQVTMILFCIFVTVIISEWVSAKVRAAVT